MTIQQHSLPYHPDSTRLFAQFANEAWAMFLDSGSEHQKSYARYDILVARPCVTLTTHNGVTTINRDGDTTKSEEDPFKLVKDILGHTHTDISPKYPFVGGAVGYFGYELNHREQLPKRTQKPNEFAAFKPWT